MNDETLRGWLKGLEDHGRPGQWAVLWVQGAVASGADQVNLSFRRQSAELSCYGGFSVEARSLAEQYTSGRIPSVEAERYWVAVLDALESFPGRLKLASRIGSQRQIVTIENGSITDLCCSDFQGASANLTLTLEPSRRGSYFSSRWKADVEALSSRLKYCPVPVMLGTALISGRTVFQCKKALMNWMEPAVGHDRFFLMQGDPKQILSPKVLSLQGVVNSGHRCSLMLSLSRVAKGTGSARVYWIRDGTLTDPVKLVGGTDALEVDIICPGDRPGLSLRDWYELDPTSLFPERSVLELARRLAGGLDSMQAEAKAYDRPIDDLLRKGKGRKVLGPLLPTLGRPYNALGGTFHDSLKAFSQRQSLKLAQD